MAELLRITPQDNVAVALTALSSGQTVTVDGIALTTVTDVPAGHKVALFPIKAGEKVIKYGFPIGYAKEDIPVGAHVHVHNLHTGLSGELTYEYHPTYPTVPQIPVATFMGYPRKDGRVGVRNELWILPTVGCVNDIARQLERAAQELVVGGVECVCAFPHPYGCSQMGDDQENTRTILADLATHPNVGGVLVLGLGCENSSAAIIEEHMGDYDKSRVRFLVCQQVEDEFAEAMKLLRELADNMRGEQRVPCPASKLVIGLKCGGSDGLSGITANPTIGRFSDMLCARGGSTVLTEVPEMFGAEGFLMDRCQNEKVFEKAVHMINGFKEYFISHNEVVYDNPSPGNKQGGITTLEDKSCGCVQKGGSAPIMDVIGYGDAVTTKGLNMLYGPGNDLVSATALTAAGAHMILFSTGRGTPFGAPAPTLKIATNSQLAAKKSTWIDFNAGVVADGEKTLDEAGADLYQLVLDVASGKQTCAEKKGFREISIFKDGVVL